MSRVARSVYYFSWYLLALGAWLLLAPNSLLAIFLLPPTVEGWIRLLGVAMVVIGYFYQQAARHDLVPFFTYTLWSRSFAFIALTVLVVSEFLPSVVFLFGGVELLGAAWTGREMRRTV